VNDLIPVADIERMGLAIAKSKLFGVQTPEQAIALMLVAQAEGRHPAIAARDYHVIQGRPTLKADAILARFQEAGGRVEWHTYTNEKAEATFSHPSGGSLRIAWTIQDAKAAGLTGKPGPWQQFPRAMLRARLISEGVRTVYPAVVCGTYTPEEVQDMPAAPTERAMGPAERVDAPQAPPAPREAATPELMTVEEVRAAVRTAAKRVGRDTVLGALMDLGYQTADQVPPESRLDVIAMLTELTPAPAEELA
jgi:hypothetical protein